MQRADSQDRSERAEGTVGRPAGELAARVRAGDVSAEEVVAAHLERIARIEPAMNAFQAVLDGEALAAARDLDARDELGDLPLAGVPVAIKDDIDVAGLSTRKGSLAKPLAVAAHDDLAVRRLREAGAIVIGKTRVPEFCTWPWTETLGFGATRNPWDPTRTPGGSSGGSAAAVAAGMVPLAVGSDGLGSIRIPGASCGLVGIKPGPGVVPRPRAAGSAWFGMSEHGPLATTVVDVALALDVMAGRVDLRDPRPPDEPLRIAVSERAPAVGVPVQRVTRRATRLVASALAAGGHDVRSADPPRPAWVATALLRRWTAGVAEDGEGLPRGLMESRSRRHAAVGRVVRRLVPPSDEEAIRLRRTMEEWFERHDVLITPALAGIPPRIGAARSWAGSIVLASRFAPFSGPWNLAQFPAAVVPAGLTRAGHPVAVQLVAPQGREGTLLRLAAEIERLRPWPRLAPVGRG